MTTDTKDNTFSDAQLKSFVYNFGVPYKEPFISAVTDLIFAAEYGDDLTPKAKALADHIFINENQVLDYREKNGFADIVGMKVPATPKFLTQRALDITEWAMNEYQKRGDKEFWKYDANDPDGMVGGIDENAATITVEDIPERFHDLFGTMCTHAWNREDAPLNAQAEELARAWQANVPGAPQGTGLATALVKLAKTQRKMQDMMDAEYTDQAGIWDHVQEFFDDEDDGKVTVPAPVTIPPAHQERFDELVVMIRDDNEDGRDATLEALCEEMNADRPADQPVSGEALMDAARSALRMDRARETGEAVPHGYDDDLRRVALAFAHYNLRQEGEDHRALANDLAARMTADPRNVHDWDAAKVLSMANEMLVAADELGLREQMLVDLTAAKDRAVAEEARRAEAAEQAEIQALQPSFERAERGLPAEDEAEEEPEDFADFFGDHDLVAIFGRNDSNAERVSQRSAFSEKYLLS